MANLVLLTGETEYPYLVDMLRPYIDPDEISHAASEQSLRDIAGARENAQSRLIGFCTSVIVPAQILNSFAGNCYNFHPAPPAYPGYRPAAFALYHGAQAFGATAHLMTSEIDSGTIVGTKPFPIRKDWSYTELSMAAYSAAASLFHRLCPVLANVTKPLPETGDHWGSYIYKQADHDRMRAITTDLRQDELERRIRAFGSVYTPLD